MKKIIVDNQVLGSVELPETENAYRIFYGIKKAHEQKKPVSLAILFNDAKLQSLVHYQKGGAQQELAELELFIAMGKILRFDTAEAEALHKRIEWTNDNAHVRLNISKRLRLLNKKKRGRASESFLFWDIENFSSVGPMFSHVIEKFAIPDERIYLAANPDSLYLYRREWEAELYDYGKRLESFQFTICDHGKNVADDVLLGQFRALRARQADVFIMTYDRELKARFKTACHISNNLYTLGK